VIGLDEPMAPYVDKYIARMVNKTNYTWGSMLELFGPNVTNVTVRHLLNMRSGIPDYDDGGLRGYQNSNPLLDIGPLDVLDMCPKTFWCVPGGCGEYSSTNFVILGLVLVELANATDWATYNQQSVFGAQAQRYTDVVFPIHGPCSAYPGIGHGYQDPPPKFNDVYNMSCLGGWTCGNMAAPVKDITNFVYELYGPPKAFLNSSTVNDMLGFGYLDRGDFPAWYGIGTMMLRFHFNKYYQPQAEFVGHGGATYGFYAMSGYNFEFDFSLVLATNMEEPTFQKNLNDVENAIYYTTIAVMNATSRRNAS